MASPVYGSCVITAPPWCKYPRLPQSLQAVAAENNLAETAFLVPSEGRYRLRWFTPTVAVPFCGHATLAAGAVVLERLEPGRESVVFDTASGPLTVDREGTAYRMELPARTVRAVPPPVGVVGRARRHTQ